MVVAVWQRIVSYSSVESLKETAQQDFRCGVVMQRFSQYGVIKPDDDGTPRVKVYRDKATKNPKGDGLVTYLYEPSVNLCPPSCYT